MTQNGLSMQILIAICGYAVAAYDLIHYG